MWRDGERVVVQSAAQRREAGGRGEKRQQRAGGRARVSVSGSASVGAGGWALVLMLGELGQLGVLGVPGDCGCMERG